MYFNLIRFREEKERRIAQHKVYEAKRKETIEKIAARAFARVYIEPLIPNVYEQLHLNGYFSDSIQNGTLDLAIYISLKFSRQPHLLKGFPTLIMGREVAPWSLPNEKQEFCYFT